MARFDEPGPLRDALTMFGGDDVKATITTMACPGCGTRVTLTVPFAGYLAWRNGAYIQDAMPELNDDDRERLMTGTCPGCWDAMFPPEEEW